MVGALVVKDGVIVGKGVHVGAGAEHAEVVALKEAGERARGAALFVTLEPCNHHGKTGPCSEAVVEAGVAKVVFGLSDPNQLASGGAEYLRRKGVEVIGGVLAEEIGECLEPWIFSINEGRELRQVLAVTALDGSLVSTQPRLVKKYFKKVPNLLSDSGRVIFEKGEFDRFILVRTMQNTGSGITQSGITESAWPLIDLNFNIHRSWFIGGLSFTIYRMVEKFEKCLAE